MTLLIIKSFMFVYKGKWVVKKWPKFVYVNIECSQVEVKCQNLQGRMKLLQSGWARPEIVLLVVKSGWTMSLFNKGQAKKWVGTCPTCPPGSYAPDLPQHVHCVSLMQTR